MLKNKPLGCHGSTFSAPFVKTKSHMVATFYWKTIINCSVINQTGSVMVVENEAFQNN